MKIKLSPLVIIMAFVLTATGHAVEFLSYLITIVIHETAHAQVSYRLGYSLNTFRLMPHGASLTGAFEGVTRRDEVIIALAGPAVNIIAAIFFIALWWLVPPLFSLTEIFVLSNLCTAGFNLLPIFPLDGGRALLSVLSAKYKREKVYKVMRITGAVFAVFFMSAFIYALIKGINFSFAFVAVFIFLSTVFPDKNSKYQRLYTLAYRTEKLKNGLVVRELMVSANATLMELSRMLNGGYYHKFSIVDNSLKKVAEISETEFEELLKECDNNSCVISALRKEKNLKY